MIGRRTLIVHLACAALPGSQLSFAQSARRRSLIGLALPNTPISEMLGADPASPLVRAFLDGLRGLGWTDSATIVERRSLEGQPQRAREVVDELLGRGVEVLVLGGARWLHDTARLATRTTPIVGLFAGDPVAGGLVDSFARPGGNLTGITFAASAEFAGKQLQILREVAPHVRRPALLANREALMHFPDIARFQGIEILPAKVDYPGEYDDAFALIRRLGADSLIAASGPPNVVNAERIAAFCAASRLPAIYGFREAVAVGGLVSYGVNVPSLFRQMGRMTARFLDGAKLGDVPIEQPTTFELVANLKTAKALGLTIPLPVLAQADEVIE